MVTLDSASSSTPGSHPLAALAWAAAADGACELLLRSTDGTHPSEDQVRTVRAATALPLVVNGALAGLTLTRMLLEAGATRVAVRLADTGGADRVRLLSEVFGAAHIDAVIELRSVVPRNPGLAASFGITTSWEAVAADSDPEGSDALHQAQVARDAGAGRVLVLTRGDGGSGLSSPPPSLLAEIGAAAGLPVAVVETPRCTGLGQAVYGVRAAGPRRAPSTAA